MIAYQKVLSFHQYSCTSKSLFTTINHTITATAKNGSRSSRRLQRLHPSPSRPPRGESLFLTGDGGRFNDSNDAMWSFARSAFLQPPPPTLAPHYSAQRPSTNHPTYLPRYTRGFVYRSASCSPSGTYIASADTRGKLQVGGALENLLPHKSESIQKRYLLV